MTFTISYVTMPLKNRTETGFFQAKHSVPGVGIGDDAHGESQFTDMLQGIRNSGIREDMPDFFRLITVAGFRKTAIGSQPAIRHELPDIFMGLEPVDGGKEIREEFVPVIVSQLLHYRLARGDLRTDKIKERVVHIKKQGCDGRMAGHVQEYVCVISYQYMGYGKGF